MQPVKIFDRIKVRDEIGFKWGSIWIHSIFSVIDAKQIINEFIEQNNTFDMLLYNASRILNINRNKLIQYYYNSNKYDGWSVHPILVKSILRHVENVITRKMVIINEIYNLNGYIMYNDVKDAMKTCTLLFIVDHVKYPNEIGGRKYECDGILDKNDMFNDDVLIYECIKQTTTCVLGVLGVLIPKCLYDIIISYISL
jgi:hypothetical protein